MTRRTCVICRRVIRRTGNCNRCKAVGRQAREGRGEPDRIELTLSQRAERDARIEAMAERAAAGKPLFAETR